MALASRTVQDNIEPESSPCEETLSTAEVAKLAGLRYVSDTTPRIRRKRVGKNFSYIGLDGKPIHDQDELQCIRSLGIPPAWTDVWICPQPNGHIQATGRDAKGRKQYRYHPHWREVRDETKYSRMIAFGEVLPTIRKRITHDISLPGLPHEKVLAAFETQTQAKKNVIEAVDITAQHLGNTRTICRKCYIHPQILDSYLDGSLLNELHQQEEKITQDEENLHPEEVKVLAFLKERFAEEVQ